ncbi:FAD-binding protein [Mycobacterium montefiorense]|uniref:FAD-binding protein n=1 Tax=Mycobacterium montefiorense TaxID=154654 RepID=UPI0019137DA8
MSTCPSTTAAAAAVADELNRRLPGDRLLTGPAYDQSCRIWNGAIDHVPALIVRPRTRVEVQIAVLAARQHNLAVSVRGGGHDWAGRALCHGGLASTCPRWRTSSWTRKAGSRPCRAAPPPAT